MNTQQYIDLISNITANRGMSIVGGILTTIFLFSLTLVLGTLLGIRLFMWRYNGNRIVVRILTVLEQYMLYIPKSTFLIFVFHIFFGSNLKFNMLAAIVALTIIFAFSVYWSIDLAMEGVDKGEIEAAYSMGYNKKTVLTRIIIPSTMPIFLYRYRENVITHVQNTAIVEIISVMDIQMVADIIATEVSVPIVPILITTVVYLCIGLGASKLIDNLSGKLKHERTAEEQKERFLKGKF